MHRRTVYVSRDSTLFAHSLPALLQMDFRLPVREWERLDRDRAHVLVFSSIRFGFGHVLFRFFFFKFQSNYIHEMLRRECILEATRVREQQKITCREFFTSDWMVREWNGNGTNFAAAASRTICRYARDAPKCVTLHYYHSHRIHFDVLINVLRLRVLAGGCLHSQTDWNWMMIPHKNTIYTRCLQMGCCGSWFGVCIVST